MSTTHKGKANRSVLREKMHAGVGRVICRAEKIRQLVELVYRKISRLRQGICEVASSATRKASTLVSYIDENGQAEDPRAPHFRGFERDCNLREKLGVISLQELKDQLDLLFVNVNDLNDQYLVYCADAIQTYHARSE